MLYVIIKSWVYLFIYYSFLVLLCFGIQTKQRSSLTLFFWPKTCFFHFPVIDQLTHIYVFYYKCNWFSSLIHKFMASLWLCQLLIFCCKDGSPFHEMIPSLIVHHCWNHVELVSFSHWPNAQKIHLDAGLFWARLFSLALVWLQITHCNWLLSFEQRSFISGLHSTSLNI